MLYYHFLVVEIVPVEKKKYFFDIFKKSSYLKNHSSGTITSKDFLKAKEKHDFIALQSSP